MKLSLNIYLMCVIVVCCLLNSITLSAQIVGQSAPTLILPDRNGQESNLADLKGNYVYLHFWASWCPNSILQLPIVTQIYDEYKDSNFKIYSVSLDANRDAWLNAIDVFQLTWPQHQCDFNGPFSHRLDNYNHIGTPFGYLISPEGIILEVDPDVHEYTEWFTSRVAEGSYYTVNIGAFSDLMHVEFDYIEEMGVVESGLNADGSYYVHVGKYANPIDAQNTLKQAIGRGYADAQMTTDIYNGEASLNYVQSPALHKYEYIPTPTPTPTPNFYSPTPSLDGYENRNDPAAISNNTQPSNQPFYQSPFPVNPTPKNVETQSPQPFYTPPKDKSVAQQNGLDLQLPDFKAYPHQEQNKELPKPVIYDNIKQEKDFLNGQNPYVVPSTNLDAIQERGYNFDDKWKDPKGGLTPLSPPENIPDLFQPDNGQEQSSENDDFYSSGFDDYSNIHPLDGVYLEEGNSTINYKESKYEKKLRLKKQKAKRKQEKLKKEIEATMKEIEDLDESLQISRQYPEY